MDDLKLAARLTQQHLRIQRLEADAARLTAEHDQLRAHARELDRRLGRIERQHELRGATIARLRVRVREARRGRDLWKHRYQRDVR